MLNPAILAGKPIIRRRRMAFVHLPGMLAAGHTPAPILAGYTWFGPEDIRARVAYRAGDHGGKR